MKPPSGGTDLLPFHHPEDHSRPLLRAGRTARSGTQSTTPKTEDQTMVAISTSDQSHEKKYKPLVIRAPDGVTIAAQEWGNPGGSEILFIHGFSQASLSWRRQVEGDLAKEFRLVTYDL